ncbi:hypothetical protein [Methanocella sp. MCL-LM]|uniref:hypothetical protein n=1 Tax=Methanocella sp. MCL-LM TaxID=3412035 RepID=UPI003C74BBFE
MVIKNDVLFIIAFTGLLCFAAGMLAGAIVFSGDTRDQNTGLVGMTGGDASQGGTGTVEGTMTGNISAVGRWTDTEFMDGQPYTIYRTFRDDNTVDISGGRVSELKYWHARVIGEDTEYKGYAPIYYNNKKLASAYVIWITRTADEDYSKKNPDFVIVDDVMYILEVVPDRTYTLHTYGPGGFR